MTRETFNRRQILGIAGTAGAGTIGTAGYLIDNPVHRATVERVDRRTLDSTPAVGTFWYDTHRLGSELPSATVTHLTGIQYRGIRNHNTDRVFDVIGVVVGRRSTIFDDGPLVGPRSLGVRGIGPSGTVAWDSGAVPAVSGGPLHPAETVAAELSLEHTQLDDEAAVRRVIDDGHFPGIGDTGPQMDRLRTDLQLAGALLERYDSRHDGRLTRAGVLYGLHGTPGAVEDAAIWGGWNPSAGGAEYGALGEQYSWRPGDVIAHVVRYNRLYVAPGDERCELKVAQMVPRPSLLGQPRIETGLVVDFPI